MKMILRILRKIQPIRSQESEVHQNIFQDPEEALALERERCQALLWCNHQNFPQISIQKFI